MKRPHFYLKQFQHLITCRSVSASFCLLLLSGLLVGCSGSGQSPSSSQFRAAANLVIPLESEVMYSFTDPAPVLAVNHPGVVCPGDVNGDGVSDVIVGTAQGRATSIPNCTITAYSVSDGAILWQVIGRSNDNSGDFRGCVEQISLVDDLDGDQFPDVFGLWGRARVKVYVFSGKTGKLLAEHRFDDKSYPLVARPMFSSQPVTSGGPSLSLFVVEKQRHPKIYQFNPSSFELLRMIDIECDDTEVKKTWALTHFGDDDGDGTSDHLVRVDMRQNSTDDIFQYEMHVVSGKDFHTVRTFRTDRPRMSTSNEGYAVLGDVNGDGKHDFAYASGAGATENLRASHVRAFSGANGEKLWELNGMQIEGKKIITVPVQNSDVQSWNDCGFSGEILEMPDRNRDGVCDLITMIQAQIEGKTRTQMVLLSGKDGSLLSMDDPAGQPMMATGIKLINVPSVNRDGDPGVAFIIHQPDVAVKIRSIPIVK